MLFGHTKEVGSVTQKNWDKIADHEFYEMDSDAQAQ